ncbi:MAG TPA: acetoin utilization protein AcuC [Candidatus Limnocylindrales bacterium]|nr:acetoin utilization protein AcuC [Candidatus Limnocylindrales bacterium]
MLLVYGPRSTDYDFGDEHPLTPRRFGPGIDLLRAVGAEPGLAPEPAIDEELRWLHERPYIDVVKRFSHDPYGFAQAGIGDGGDCPPFADMHEASAAVVGGSVRAVESILRGDIEHALHPGGGLHHAMPARASGFCIYNDPAIAIARARRDGLRVMYIDLDVHHGDGVQAMHWADPGVLTVSIHETGRALFPGTGEADEIGEGVAAGTSVNVPLLPGTGEGAWLASVESLLPELAATFGPDLIVSQHGADSHAWDPLAHLNVTTTAHGRAARLVDAIAHRYAAGRWLATGGGGYDAYRVVPRTWALTWLAGAHREVPSSTPAAWRDRWATEAARYGQAPLPATFDDEPNAGLPLDGEQEMAAERGRAVAAVVRRAVVPRLVREAVDRGWWDPLGAGAGAGTETVAGSVAGRSDGTPTIVAEVDAAAWSRWSLAPRVVAPFGIGDASAIVGAALVDGARVSAAIVGSTVVGLAVSAQDARADRGSPELLALGVARSHRRRGLAGRLLAEHVVPGTTATVTLAERDVVDPLDRDTRALVAHRLLSRAGFMVEPADAAVRAVDPSAIVARSRTT